MRLSVFVLTVAAMGQTASADENWIEAGLRNAGCTILSREGLVLCVKCRKVKGPIYINTENITREVRNSDATPGQKQEMKRRYVALLTTGDRNYPRSRSLLRPKLATLATVKGWIRLMPKTVVRFVPLAGDLVVVPAFDERCAITIATDDELRALRLSPEQAVVVAVKNLEKLPTAPLEVVNEEPGAPVVTGSDADNYAAARLLVPSVRARFEKLLGGPAAFAVPDRDHLIAVRADHQHAVDLLRTVATQLEATQSYPLSSDLVQHSAEGWRRLQPRP